MGQLLHGSARTTEVVRRAIQNSQESIAKLAKRYNLNPKTVAKWKRRDFVPDAQRGPKQPRSTSGNCQKRRPSSWPSRLLQAGQPPARCRRR